MTIRSVIEEAQAEVQISAEEHGGSMPRTMSMSGAGLKRLQDRKLKDAQEVAAGVRDPRSLLLFQTDPVKDMTLMGNPTSEFRREGEGWRLGHELRHGRPY